VSRTSARRDRKSKRHDTLIELMGPPLSTVAWSPAFTAQTLEILPVGLRDGKLFWLKPVHADSLRIGLPPSAGPGEMVIDALKWYPLAPLVVHSTSWRHDHGRVILTYVAVVEAPQSLPDGSLVDLPVTRAKLARGGAMSAPDEIGVAAVLEHALRHLSWLVQDDPAVAKALAAWTTVLKAFSPEPFRALA
jgi:hypothetical protein